MKRMPIQSQKDASRLETDRVQYWRGGVMVSGQVKLAEARGLVQTGHAFVINGQAIGAVDEDGFLDS